MLNDLCFRQLLSQWGRTMLMLELDRDDIRLGGVGVDWREGLAAKVVNARSGALVAVSAVAATMAWREIERRRVLRADLPESSVRVERLADPRYDRERPAPVGG